MEQKVVDQIMNVQLELIQIVEKLFALNLLPKVTLLLYCTRLGKLKQLRRAHQELLLPIIKACKQRVKDTGVISYVDSLFKLKVPADNEGNMRELSEEEIMSFISEFLDASIRPASATLEWIMARLTKTYKTS